VNVIFSLCTSTFVAAVVYSDVGIFKDEGGDAFSCSGGVLLQKQRIIKWCSLK